MADIWAGLGLGLTQGANTATRLMPMYYQGVAAQKNADLAAAKAEKEAAEMAALNQKWLADNMVNPAKESYKNATGSTEAQANEDLGLENPDQAKGAAVMMEKIARDKAENDNKSSQVAGAITIGSAASPTSSVQQSPEADALQVQFGKATIEQESGEKGYSAVGVPTRSGEKALGKYQIMPSSWFSKIGLDPKSESDKKRFLESEQLQDELASIVFQDAWKQSGGDPFKAALVYYTGKPNPKNIDVVPTDANGVAIGPTPREYAEQVVEKMNRPPDLAAAPGSPIIPGQPQAGFTSGPAGTMLEKEVLKGPPEPVDIRDAYQDKITSLLNSPEYINASPSVRKKFLNEVVSPYQELANRSVKMKGLSVNDFNRDMATWSSNARAVMAGEIKQAGQISRNKGLAKANQLLTKVQGQIKRINSMRKAIASASGEKKKKLLEEFREFSITQDKEGIWASIQRKVGWSAEEIVLDEKKIDTVMKALTANEAYLMNQLMGSAGMVFQDLYDDIPTEREKISTDNDFNDAVKMDDD